MKKFLLALGLAGGCHLAQAATTNITPWTPSFQGVDIAYATVTNTTVQNLAIICQRVDLTSPGIKLITTPRCTNSCGLETVSENTSHFLEQYGVQLAVNCNFYASSGGPGDAGALGVAEDVYGLAVSKGEVVSPNQTTFVSPQGYVLSTLLFTTNNQASFVASNNPAASLDGIYTAMTGNHSFLVGGVNSGDNTPSDLDPRTAAGLSQDRRYLYVMIVDGRQSGWSDGLNNYGTAEWLARFGAYDGINLDGGGSTTMCMADCQGKSVRLNKSSYVAQYGRERYLGHNFGVYATPLQSEIKKLSVQPGSTTAVLTWHTETPATTQVEYGPTSSYGSTTPLDARLVREHAATLNVLGMGSNYFFRAISASGSVAYTQACTFVTANAISRSLLIPLTSAWRFTTNNLDGTPAWKTREYDDSSWPGPSNACLHIESSMGTFPPRNTILPPGIGANPIMRTYQFRTHFGFTGSTSGLTLTFSNYVDDGAVFYLNGTEIQRIRMGVTNITFGSAASSRPCQGTPQAGDALLVCPDVFTIGGNLLTNLFQGDNVVAVEVHGDSAIATDVLFGSALIANVPSPTVPRLFITSEGGISLLSWNGTGFTLQRSTDLSSPANWSDVPGPITQSSATITNGPSTFYRLRN